MNNQSPFKWRHFESEIILLCVRWYLRYSLSYRDLEEMMLERGLHVDHSTIYCWVQHYAPELEKRCRPHLKACNDSWRVDETYTKVKKVWVYLYRAVDSEGNTLEFLLSPIRGAAAAKRFFVKALHSTADSASQARPVEEQVAQPMSVADPNTSTSALRVINIDKNAAYPKAIAELKASGALPESVELRPVKYLNNIVEQDHRFIKRLVKPGMGFFSVETSWRTLQGYEVMNMIRKGQMQGVNKGDSPSQAAFIALCWLLGTSVLKKVLSEQLLAIAVFYNMRQAFASLLNSRQFYGGRGGKTSFYSFSTSCSNEDFYGKVMSSETAKN